MRFQINIYRPGRKPKKLPKPKGEERRISVAILIPLMVLLLVGIIFFPKWGYMDASSSLDRRVRMNRRNKIYLMDELTKVEKEKEKASNELKLLSSLRVKRVLWFRKLMDLSEIMPDDLWLTDLSIKTIEKKVKGSREVEAETYLTIKGVTDPSPGREPLDSIAQLILSLNDSDSFKQDFELFTLARLSREKDRSKKGREIMEFELSSKLKDGYTGGGGKASK